MNSVLKSAVLALSSSVAVVSMTGCGWLAGDDGYFRDRGQDYRHAKVNDPVVLPVELKGGSAGESLLVIPPIAASVDADAEFELPVPPKIAVNVDEQLVRIQKLGEQQWILVNLDAGELWPRIRDFLYVNDVPLALEQGSAGNMDTQWLLAEGRAGLRERYRFHVQPGVQLGSSEVHITQNQQPRSAQPSKTWPATSVDSDREAWMARQLAEFIASASVRPSVSLLAQSISNEPRMTLVKGVRELPFLLLNLPYNRAWASMSVALQKAEFTVNQKDADNGVYLVTYAPALSEDEKPGMLARMIGMKGPEYSDQPYAGESFVIQLRDLVKDGQKGVEVSVQRADEQATRSVEVTDIFNLFKGFLS